MPRISVIFLGIFAEFALGSRAANATPGFGDVDDVPTWRAGDQWTYNRTFTVMININSHIGAPVNGDLIMDLPVNVTDVFTKTVDSTVATTVNTGSGGFSPTRAYTRKRATGLLSATGTATSNNVAGLSTFTATLSGFTNIDSTNGGTSFDWVSVGELAEIREKFGIPNKTGNLHIDCNNAGPCTSIICPFLPSLTGGLMCGDNSTNFNANITIDHNQVGTNPTRASIPLLDHSDGTRSIGDGSLAGLAPAVTAQQRDWTLTAVNDGPFNTWTVTSVPAGTWPDATSGAFYSNSEITFAIIPNNSWDGTADGGGGDRFRFTVNRDPYTPWDAAGGGLELVDFPTLSTGERHQDGVNRHIYGTVVVDPAGTALDITANFDADIIGKYDITVNGGAGGAAATPRVLNGSVAGFTDTIQYTPSTRAMNFWSWGSVVFVNTFKTKMTLQTFTDNITSFTPVAGGFTMALTSINPVTPRPGELFTVMGTATAGSQLTATVQLPGGGGYSQSTPIIAGAFSIILRAPSRNDNSPMPNGSANRDFGSFGIEFISNAPAPSNRIVGTVRLNKPFVNGVLAAIDPTVLRVLETAGNAPPPIAVVDAQGIPMITAFDIDIQTFATGNGSAVAPGDYTSKSFPAMTILAGQKYAWPTLAIYGTPMQNNIPIIDDALSEGTEFFDGTISGIAPAETDAEIGAPLIGGTVEIIDNEITPIPSMTPTATPTASISPTQTATPSPSESPTPTETPSPSATPTASETPSASPTGPTPTETPTLTPSPTETESPTPTESETPTASPTESEIPTTSPTETESATPTPPASPSISPTASISPTPNAASEWEIYE